MADPNRKNNRDGSKVPKSYGHSFGPSPKTRPTTALTCPSPYQGGNQPNPSYGSQLTPRDSSQSPPMPQPSLLINIPLPGSTQRQPSFNRNTDDPHSYNYSHAQTPPPTRAHTRNQRSRTVSNVNARPNPFEAPLFSLIVTPRSNTTPVQSLRSADTRMVFTLDMPNGERVGGNRNWERRGMGTGQAGEGSMVRGGGGGWKKEEKKEDWVDEWKRKNEWE